MPRAARIVAPGLPHHITQRGNNREAVFFTDDDRRYYLRTLRDQAERFGLAISAYCLMPNHVHLVATPRERDALAKAIGTTHLLYTQHINRTHERSGHLWQNRFYSCPLDSDHEVAAIRYLERNPVRANLVRVPWRYPWSSAAAHTGNADLTGLLDLAEWRQRFTPSEWKRVLGDVNDEREEEALEAALGRGRPLGNERFIAKLEQTLRQPLRARPRGRPAARPQP